MGCGGQITTVIVSFYQVLPLFGLLSVNERLMRSDWLRTHTLLEIALTGTQFLPTFHR